MTNLSKFTVFVAAAVGVLLVAEGPARVAAQVRAALVQDVNMQGFRPYKSECYRNDPIGICADFHVPAGYRFVVEHISGSIETLAGSAVRTILIQAGSGANEQRVYLPAASPSPEWFHEFGFRQTTQFGSPARMYVEGGTNLRLLVQAYPNEIRAYGFSAIGYLVQP